MPRRRIAIAAAVAAVAALALTLTFWLQIVRLPGHVPPPGADATPQQVVQTFLEAINQHDCDTAAAMWVDSGASSGRQWCDDLSSVSAKYWPPARDCCVAGTVDVAVEETVTVRPFHVTGTAGNTFDWSYSLVKTTVGWRIAGNGMG